MLGFFAGTVENGTDGARDVRGHLQQQRRFSDAGLAAEQHERAGHDAAAEHAIELRDARRNARRVGCLDVAIQLGGRAARDRAVAMIRGGGRGLRSGHLFDERVPGAAIGAAPHPLWLLAAAFLTGEDGLRGFHADDGTSSRCGLGDKLPATSESERRCAGVLHGEMIGCREGISRRARAARQRGATRGSRRSSQGARGTPAAEFRSSARPYEPESMAIKFATRLWLID